MNQEIGNGDTRCTQDGAYFIRVHQVGTGKNGNHVGHDKFSHGHGVGRRGQHNVVEFVMKFVNPIQTRNLVKGLVNQCVHDTLNNNNPQDSHGLLSHTLGGGGCTTTIAGDDCHHGTMIGQGSKHGDIEHISNPRLLIEGFPLGLDVTNL